MDYTNPDASNNALVGILDMGLDSGTLARLQDRIHNSTRKRKGGRRKKKKQQKEVVQPEMHIHDKGTHSTQLRAAEQQEIRTNLKYRMSLNINSFEHEVSKNWDQKVSKVKDVRDTHRTMEEDEDDNIDEPQTSPGVDEFAMTGRSRRAGTPTSFLSPTHAGNQKVRARSPSPLRLKHRACLTFSTELYTQS